MEDHHPPKCSPSPKPDFPLELLKSPLPLFLISFALLVTTGTAAAATTNNAPTSITPSNFLTFYTNHCNGIVPESPLSPDTDFVSSRREYQALHFDIAYVTGGSQILPKAHAGSSSSSISVSFMPKRNSISPTQNPTVFNLQASLRFHLSFHSNNTWGRNLREIRFRAPRIPIKPRALGFDLYGFWSMRTGKLCMVGSGSSNVNLVGVSTLSVVLKLNYPVNFSEVGSLISGVLESLSDGEGSLGYFEPVSVLAIPHFGKYNYTLIHRGSGDVCASGNDDGSGGKDENLQLQILDRSRFLAQLYRYARKFELDYGSECGNDEGKCNPLGEGFGLLPKFMEIQGIRGGNGGAMRGLIVFSESGNFGYGPFAFERVFDPNSVLIGEGMWDEKKDRLCMVACHFLNVKNSLANVSVGDCSIRLSLRFPKNLTIRQRNIVLGQISSNKTVNQTGYFREVEFHGPGNELRPLPAMKYEYTVLDRVSKSCAEKKILKGKGKTYPNGYSSNMRFDMLVTNGQGQAAEGYSSPFFVGDQLYEPYGMSDNHSSLLNISYKISFKITSDFRLGGKNISEKSVEIAAEGMYDTGSGVLCMIGCWNGVSPINNSMRNDSGDCDILVNAQFSPLNAKSRVSVKGTIESLREKSDPLYFGQLEMSSRSIYTSQAAESIWRMDIEITMVLISNTLACVFVGLQLYHVKRHPDLLPSISFVMLVVLTLGHMIPLLLNFEALFMNKRNRQNVFLESGGWLEVNEVAVRVVTMVAFLLQFRLLQLTWSARHSAGNHESLWLYEKKVLYVSLPFYISGALIAWFVHQWKNTYLSPYLRLRDMGNQHNYPWRDLKSYAGLILDGFLIPQIIFNLFSNSRENTLAFPFYFGTTVVRLLPHAYDLYRAHSSAWYLNLSYIYADHVQDFYSTAWDVVIQLCGVLFASLIYLQQRFGGRFMFPQKFRNISEYEKVPIVGEELREEAG